MTVKAPLTSELETPRDLDDAIVAELHVDVDSTIDSAIDIEISQPIEPALRRGDLDMLAAAPPEPVPFMREPVFPFVVLGSITFVAIVVAAYLLAIGV